MPVNTDAGVTTDSSTPCPAIDTSAALWLLASVAQLYQRPFDATLILARYPPPFDYPTLIEALALLGIQAGLQPWPEKNQALPLPAVAFLAQAPASALSGAHQQETSGQPVLMPVLLVQYEAAAHGVQVGWVKPGEQQVEQLALQDAKAISQTQLLLLVQAEPAVADDGEQPAAKPFGFAWFIPELLRHRAIWRDILLASLAIQLVGLATPLFTQVIIDKVIAHQSQSTLQVLGVALVVFMLFTSGMSWLRQYLVLHTGSRIDAVLGEKVMQHLLRAQLCTAPA